jgi:hypothetical protein
MARVTELRVRSDWQVIRFVYLPAASIGMTPIHLCAVCIFCSWWGHHLEEWVNRKPMFRITNDGIRYEDGGKPVTYRWADISGIALHRRGTVPFWKTGGEIKTGTPRFWLELSVVQVPGHQPRPYCVWPRQVVGGLWSLVRFAKEPQRQLVRVSNHGEIPSLLPRKKAVNS